MFRVRWHRGAEERLRRLLLPAGIVGGFAILLGCLLVFPGLIVDADLGRQQLTADQRVKAINDVCATLLQGLGGAVLLLGAYFTGRQVLVAREGQLTERFTRAIDQLGDDKLPVRLGGIYALERLAVESERDRKAIIDVLAAYVRAHSPRLPEAENELSSDSPTAEILPLAIRAADVQAAVTVLGRRGPIPVHPLVWHLAD